MSSIAAEAAGALTGTGRGLDRARRVVECPDCGLRQALVPIRHGACAYCARCFALLRRSGSAETGLALALAGLILIALANFLPLLTLEFEGRSVTASLASGALVLAARGLWPLGLLILLLTVVVPALKLGGIAVVLLGIRVRRPPPAIVPVLRSLNRLSAWAMVDVYMLGLFVAYVKLAAFATVVLGIAVYALAALMVVMAAMDASLDFDAVWEEAEAKGVVG
ncbi:MAG: paraquat-inducible protein A, partial [Stellaceae bacterium]